jgi:hypothetical protein
MRELLMGFFLGLSVGFWLAWTYFRFVRLIRTKREWYSDPEVARRFPEEAARFRQGRPDDKEDDR